MVLAPVSIVDVTAIIGVIGKIKRNALVLELAR